MSFSLDQMTAKSSNQESGLSMSCTRLLHIMMNILKDKKPAGKVFLLVNCVPWGKSRRERLI